MQGPPEALVGKAGPYKRIPLCSLTAAERLQKEDTLSGTLPLLIGNTGVIDSHRELSLGAYLCWKGGHC